jgi:hypothetical protein
MFGFAVFTCTVSTVIALLFFGGTFKRITEQTTTGKSSVESDYRVRLERPLLLERLLSAQERMLKLNYPNSRPKRTDDITNLTKMLSSVPPPKDTASNDKNTTEEVEIYDFSQQNSESMVGYKQNFFMGYRKCQDKPGGEFCILFFRTVS